MDLLVTIDTEEEDLWSGSYRRSGCTVQNVRNLGRFQQLCDEYEIRPTYLVDSPVVEDDAASELLGRIQDSGRAEIGAHLHPWCCPPFSEEVTRRNSFMCNLPAELQAEKLTILTNSIEQRFGRRPTSFRAGRYGLEIEGARALAKLNYLVDSSVIPFMSYSSEGGPDFSKAPYVPYYLDLDGEDIRQPQQRGFLLEVPVSVGYSHKGFQTAQRLRSIASRPLLRKLRMVGILDRLGVARRIKFSPEQHSASEMNRLVDVYSSLGAPCIVMLLHSSSLSAGFSPYASTATQLEKLYACLESVFRYCRVQLQMTARTLSEFALQFNGHPGKAVVPAAQRTVSPLSSTLSDSES